MDFCINYDKAFTMLKEITIVKVSMCECKLDWMSLPSRPCSLI